MCNPPKKLPQKPDEEKVPETLEEEVIFMFPWGVGDIVFGVDLDYLMNQLVDLSKFALI